MAAKLLSKMPAPLVLTNSSRSMFLNCQQKYKYAYEELLTPKQGKGFLEVGNIFHKAHEKILFKTPLPEVQSFIRAEVKKSRRGFIGDSTKFEKDSSIIEGMIVGYHKNQGVLKNAKIPLIKGKPAVELPFEIRVTPDVVLMGKIDALVKLDDGYWLVEHKSTGRLDGNYIDKLPINSQITTYLWAMQRFLPKEIAQMLRGVIYNVMGKTQIRRTQKESETQFLDRLIEEYLAPINRSKYYFQRKYLRTSAQLERFHSELLDTAENITRCQKSGRWQQNEFFCTYYGKCEFLQLCVQGRKSHVLAGFTKRQAAHKELDQEEITQ